MSGKLVPPQLKFTVVWLGVLELLLEGDEELLFELTLSSDPVDLKWLSTLLSAVEQELLEE